MPSVVVHYVMPATTLNKDLDFKLNEPTFWVFEPNDNKSEAHDIFEDYIVQLCPHFKLTDISPHLEWS